jgi:hypothetical protein
MSGIKFRSLLIPLEGLGLIHRCFPILLENLKERFERSIRFLCASRNVGS